MKFFEMLDSTMLRGYALCAAVVTTLLGSILAIDVFPQTFRQIAAVFLLGGTAAAIFVVYAPKLEGHIHRRRWGRTLLAWEADRKNIFTEKRTNLFWVYLGLNSEVTEWCERNCSGQVGVMPIKGAAKADGSTKTVWFSDPNDALHFKMVWR